MLVISEAVRSILWLLVGDELTAVDGGEARNHNTELSAPSGGGDDDDDAENDGGEEESLDCFAAGCRVSMDRRSH